MLTPILTEYELTLVGLLLTEEAFPPQDFDESPHGEIVTRNE